MYKSPDVFTLTLLAPHFGLSAGELGDLAYPNLNVEDGLMWIIGVHGHEEMGLTFVGIENIAELLADQGNKKAAQVLGRLREQAFIPTSEPA